MKLTSKILPITQDFHRRFSYSDSGSSTTPAGYGGGATATAVTISSANATYSTDSQGRAIIIAPADDVILASVPFVADVLVTAGGAGGGTGGGGGAGQLRCPENDSTCLGVSFGTITPLAIGLGGLGSTGSLKSNQGGHSWLVTNNQSLTATGGGPVGILAANSAQYKCGSGAGAASANTGGPFSGGPGTTPGGNVGGNTVSIASPFAGSGGGGAGSAGGNSTVAGHGGDAGLGLASTITGSSVIYSPGSPGIGFSNGGVGSTPGAAAPGGSIATNGANGTAGTAPGSGGAGAFNANTGAPGTKGIVVIRPTSQYAVTPGTKTIKPAASAIVEPIGSGLIAFWHVIKLSGWAGNCLQVTRSSDSTTLDIGFVNNVVDWESADQFAGPSNSTLTVSKIYDQSGNGNDLICSGSGPVGLPTFGGLNTWVGGIRPVSFQGDGITSSQRAQCATITGNANSISVYQVSNTRTSTDYNGYWNLMDAALSASYAYNATNNGTVLIHRYSGVTLNSNLYARAGLGVMSTSDSGTTGTIVRVNGQQVTNSGNATSQAFGGFRIGLATTASGAVSGLFDWFGTAIYNVAHTSPQMISVENALTASLNMQTSFTNRHVYSGNSLVTGLKCTLNQQAPWQAGYGKSSLGPVSSWETLIMGVQARTLATEYSIRTTLGALFDNTKTLNYFTISDATNDISVATVTSQVDAETQADTLYNSTTLPYVSYLQGLGFNKVIVPTIICRGAFTTANFKEYFRLRYNLNVRNGAIANGYTVSDRAAIDGSYLDGTLAYNDPTYFGDSPNGTHLSNYGYLKFGLCDRQATLGF